MPVNGSHGACPCSGGSSSQRAAGGRARRSRRHRGALSQALDLLLPFSKKQSSGGDSHVFSFPAMLQAGKVSGKGFFCISGNIRGKLVALLAPLRGSFPARRVAG